MESRRGNFGNSFGSSSSAFSMVFSSEPFTNCCFAFVVVIVTAVVVKTRFVLSSALWRSDSSPTRPSCKRMPPQPPQSFVATVGVMRLLLLMNVMARARNCETCSVGDYDCFFFFSLRLSFNACRSSSWVLLAKR